MSKQVVLKVTLIFGLILSLASVLFAFLSGGDLFSIFIERFLLTFAIASFLMWGTLSIINSVLMKAALDDYATGGKKKERGKGDRIDYTSAPSSGLLEEDKVPAPDKVATDITSNVSQQ